MNETSEHVKKKFLDPVLVERKWKATILRHMVKYGAITAEQLHLETGLSTGYCNALLKLGSEQSWWFRLRLNRSSYYILK